MVNPGVQVKTFRKALNMTQKQLAKLVNIDESMINKIENGRSTGSIQTLANIAAALGVCITELIGKQTLSNKEDNHV
ncbi:helix-turn-helix domain-containing protein [Sporomusa sp. KB1]|uniref:helix-turn-helix domain-containing protein n=1 Tax=Sporomusa sp. KB1 TaxID=943346 RepID=UPI0011A8C591|nr:helix-turn-helix transcriptional regulator [Sporomusa sp. KB1]